MDFYLLKEEKIFCLFSQVSGEEPTYGVGSELRMEKPKESSCNQLSTTNNNINFNQRNQQHHEKTDKTAQLNSSTTFTLTPAAVDAISNACTNSLTSIVSKSHGNAPSSSLKNNGTVTSSITSTLSSQCFDSNPDSQVLASTSTNRTTITTNSNSNTSNSNNIANITPNITTSTNSTKTGSLQISASMAHKTDSSRNEATPNEATHNEATQIKAKEANTDSNDSIIEVDVESESVIVISDAE